MVVEAFLLLNEVVAVAVLVAGGRRGSLGRDLHARDQEPLHKREDYPDDGGDRDHDLRPQVRKQRTPHLVGTLASSEIRAPENAEREKWNPKNVLTKSEGFGETVSLYLYSQSVKMPKGLIIEINK